MPRIEHKMVVNGAPIVTLTNLSFSIGQYGKDVKDLKENFIIKPGFSIGRW